VPEEGFYRAGRTRPGPQVHRPRPGPAPGSSRPGGGSSRRPRWDTDAGITDRDVAALCWLGQQYAARSDVLRVLLGRLSPGSPRVEGQLGDATLRDVLDRWEDRGLIARDRLLGHLWVAPTPKALRLVGLDVRAWSFVIPQLAHVQPSASSASPWSQASLKAAAGCQSGSCAARPAKATSPTPPSSSPTTRRPPPAPASMARTSTPFPSGSRSRSS
jgi:hypothetical protein